jgi:type I restriction-modification system DNA methylase subunit
MVLKKWGLFLPQGNVTKFAVDCLGVTWRDKVYDPACGTGGFLVAAMDYVRQSNCTKEEFDRFKNDGLWGVEIEDSVLLFGFG